MKKLICQKEVEEAVKRNEKTLYIDATTIITPAARDAAKSNGIEFEERSHCCSSSPEASESVRSFNGDLTAEMFYSVLKNMADRGMLNKALEGIENQPSQTDCSGVKLFYGNRTRLDNLDTGTVGAKAAYKELVGKPGNTNISAGFLEIDNSSFDWELSYDEIDYIVEGEVTINIDGRRYAGKAGDVFYLPNGSKVVWEVKGKAKMFYATYPAL